MTDIRRRLSKILNMYAGLGGDAQRKMFEENGAKLWTVNEIVAYNLRRARVSRKWSQDRLAEALEDVTGRPWSNATVSAAERSRESGRVRKFDAAELVAFSRIFSLPVAYFLLPPDDDGDPDELLFIATASAVEDLFQKDVPDDRPDPMVTPGELLAALEPFALPGEYAHRLRDLLFKYQGRRWSPRQSTLQLRNPPMPPFELVELLRKTALAVESSLRDEVIDTAIEEMEERGFVAKPSARRKRRS